MNAPADRIAQLESALRKAINMLRAQNETMGMYEEKWPTPRVKPLLDVLAGRTEGK